MLGPLVEQITSGAVAVVLLTTENVEDPRMSRVFQSDDAAVRNLLPCLTNRFGENSSERKYPLSYITGFPWLIILKYDDFGVSIYVCNLQENHPGSEGSDNQSEKISSVCSASSERFLGAFN